jgi:hypothetical protein
VHLALALVKTYTRTVEARSVTFLAVVAVASAAAVVPVVALAASVCWLSTSTSRMGPSSARQGAPSVGFDVLEFRRWNAHACVPQRG